MNWRIPVQFLGLQTDFLKQEPMELGILEPLPEKEHPMSKLKRIISDLVIDTLMYGENSNIYRERVYTSTSKVIIKLRINSFRRKSRERVRVDNNTLEYVNVLRRP